MTSSFFSGLSKLFVKDIVLAAIVRGLAIDKARKAINVTCPRQLYNAMAVLANNINTARSRLGLTVLTYAGTVVTPGTIPACDLTTKPLLSVHLLLQKHRLS